MFRRNKNVWVTASEAGSAVYCPHTLQLKYAGAKVSKHARYDMSEGVRGHNAVNAAAADSRCFVATRLYGAQDTVTCNLGTYRDEILERSLAGRIFIRIYYRLSPYLVKAVDRKPLLMKNVRKIVDFVTGVRCNTGDNVND